MRLLFTLLVLFVLSACGGGGGGGGSPRMPVIEPEPEIPLEARTYQNPDAVDPLLSFKTVQFPTASKFDYRRTVPDTWTLETTTYSPQGFDAPDELVPMMHRAFKLWSRRIDNLIQPGNNHQGASHREPGVDNEVHIDFVVGYTILTGCNVACTNHHGDTQFPPEGRSSTIPVFVLAQDYFGDRYGQNYFTEDGEFTVDGFKVLAHEFGHIFNYTAPDGNNHADCDGEEGIMCDRGPYNEELIPVGPTGQDFDGITHHYSLRESSDHEVFGIWASVQDTDSGLNEFGVRVTRTLTADQVPATVESRQQAVNNVLQDRIRIETMISGTPSDGPVTGMGTATWSGDLIAVDTTRFQPVLGDAELSMDLEDISTLEASFTDMQRTDDAGMRHNIADASYTLMKHESTYLDEHGRIDARFYAIGTDDIGAVAGRLDDSTRNLMGAYGATRD